jgi:putative restriction endonuclease
LLSEEERTSLEHEDFENGKHYYAIHGQPVFWPNNPEQRPKQELLEWHQTNSFLG